MATPKIIIDMMLMREYGWTPQQIDEIPKSYIEIMMMAINAKIETEAGLQVMEEIQKENEIKKSTNKMIGSGIKTKIRLK